MKLPKFKINLFDIIKERKEPIIMVGATVAELAAVALALKNGAKIKRKLDDIHEEEEDTGEKYSAVDVCKEIATEALPVIGLTILSISGFWFARKLNLDIVSTAINAAALATSRAERAESFEKAAKETLPEEDYQKVREKRAENVVNETFSDPKGRQIALNNVIHTGYGDQLFIHEYTGQAFTASKQWILDKYSEYRDSFYDNKMEYVPIKQYDSVNTLLGLLHLDDTRRAFDDIMFSVTDLPYPRFKYPEGDPFQLREQFGCDYVILTENTEPEVMPTGRKFYD